MANIGLAPAGFSEKTSFFGGNDFPPDYSRTFDEYKRIYNQAKGFIIGNEYEKIIPMIDEAFSILEEWKVYVLEHTIKQASRDNQIKFFGNQEIILYIRAANVWRDNMKAFASQPLPPTTGDNATDINNYESFKTFLTAFFNQMETYPYVSKISSGGLASIHVGPSKAYKEGLKYYYKIFGKVREKIEKFKIPTATRAPSVVTHFVQDPKTGERIITKKTITGTGSYIETTPTKGSPLGFILPVAAIGIAGFLMFKG